MAIKPKQLAPKPPRRRKKRKRQITLTTLRRFVREGWRVIRAVIRAVLAAPLIIRAIVIPTLIFLLWFGLNWAYHTINKPTEILFPLDRSLNKRPVETWQQYESLFRKHSTTIITAEFLAALAQVESGGNPVARTYWRWQLTWNPLEWYRPASSAVGMYQITDGTFHEAMHYCIHDHVVIEDGPWHDLHSCWFNSLYTRVVPSHAIEMTAALLDRHVTQTMRQTRLGAVTLKRKQNLAAVIHLCGAGAGRTYAARGLRLTPNQQCGDHDVSNYLARINTLKYAFAKPTAGDKTIRQAR